MSEQWKKKECCAQRLGSVTGEALPYFLGLPLVGGARNYSRADAAVAEACVALLAAFAKTGEPAPARADERHADVVAWPRYELNTQQYLSIGRASHFIIQFNQKVERGRMHQERMNLCAGSKLRVKSHYRGHKLALWLHLIPQLHRPGAAPRHHQFRATHPDMFAGQSPLLLFT